MLMNSDIDPLSQTRCLFMQPNIIKKFLKFKRLNAMFMIGRPYPYTCWCTAYENGKEEQNYLCSIRGGATQSPTHMLI